MARFRHNLRDERGMTLIRVGVGLVAFLAATMLSVDAGVTMVSRTQSQNAADAGATNQGMADLIEKDPNAYWDVSNKKVVSTMHPSPRVVAIPLFDPMYYFIEEGMPGGSVIGHITPIGGLFTGNGGGPSPVNAFPKAIVLVT